MKNNREDDQRTGIDLSRNPVVHAAVEYVPPNSDIIRAFARSVCEALADETNDPIFTQPHVIRGLAGFLEIAARAQAKQLNSQQSVDRAEK